MKRIFLFIITLNVFAVLSVSAQSSSELRQKAIAESNRFWNEVRTYNKSQDFDLAFKMNTDMPMKQLLLEFENAYKRYCELFNEYYNCFDEDGVSLRRTPGWETHVLAVSNISMTMNLHWKLLKLKMLEQAYFQNPTDQGLRDQVLKGRRDFKEAYFNACYVD
jgi:hypothetical protein